MRGSPIHVAFATDANFIHYTTVALYSVLAHTTRPVRATILFDDVTEADRQKLIRSCSRFNASIEFVPVDMRSIGDLPVLLAQPELPANTLPLAVQPLLMALIIRTTWVLAHLCFLH